jgi:heme-degrading monooxygenase HmoA
MGERPPFLALVRLRAPDGSPQVVPHAYRAARPLLAGVPGYTGCVLLRSVADRCRYLMVIHWTDEAAFAEWEAAHRRAGHPSPLRGFSDRADPRGHVERLAVTAAHGRMGTRA